MQAPVNIQSRSLHKELDMEVQGQVYNKDTGRCHIVGIQNANGRTRSLSKVQNWSRHDKAAEVCWVRRQLERMEQ
jgi:hypothetical protein